VTFSEETILSYAKDIVSAAGHLHGLGIAHGDLYAHNTLVSPRSALVSDFGAACAYGESKALPGKAIERIEARAFGILLSELLERVSVGCNEKLTGALRDVARRCMAKEVMARPGFEEIERELRSGLFF
jgi:tRNA A-37 threonylcarbamoyl transferase component Bud32